MNLTRVLYFTTSTVGDVLRDFKKFTNKKILKALEQDDKKAGAIRPPWRKTSCPS